MIKSLNTQVLNFVLFKNSDSQYAATAAPVIIRTPRYWKQWPTIAFTPRLPVVTVTTVTYAEDLLTSIAEYDASGFMKEMTTSELPAKYFISTASSFDEQLEIKQTSAYSLNRGENNSGITTTVSQLMSSTDIGNIRALSTSDANINDVAMLTTHILNSPNKFSNGDAYVQTNIPGRHLTLWK